VVEFRCGNEGCSLSAIRTGSRSLEYTEPRKAKNVELAVISVPLKSLATD
jgi:hypothetical protein